MCQQPTWCNHAKEQRHGSKHFLAMQVAIDYHPFAKGATLWNCVCVMYLSIFSLYWLYSLCHAVRDIHAASDIRHFTTHKLGLSESQLKTVTWPEVAKRIVNVRPAPTALCCPEQMLKWYKHAWLPFAGVTAVIPCVLSCFLLDLCLLGFPFTPDMGCLST